MPRAALPFAFMLMTASALRGAEPVDIGTLLEDPKPYHAKRVSVVGLAHVDPCQIYLYEDEANARKLDSANSIFMLAPYGEPFPEEYNRFWVRITGIVDAESHGRFGGIPCEMMLEKLEPIRRETQAKLWLTDIGNFRNATGLTIRIGIESDTKGESYSVGPIEPEEIMELVIHNGKIRIVDNTDRSKTLLLAPIRLPQRTGRENEPEDREFHYVVYRDRMEDEPVMRPAPAVSELKRKRR